MMHNLKLEWGNRKHIDLVRHYDLRMRGLMPVLLRTCIDFCFATQKGDLHGPWYFERTGGRITYNQHCIAMCPGCGRDVELVWSSRKYNDADWHSCKKCKLEFELRHEKMVSFHFNELKVYVKQEVEA